MTFKIWQHKTLTIFKETKIYEKEHDFEFIKVMLPDMICKNSINDINVYLQFDFEDGTAVTKQLTKTENQIGICNIGYWLTYKAQQVVITALYIDNNNVQLGKSNKIVIDIIESKSNETESVVNILEKALEDVRTEVEKRDVDTSSYSIEKIAETIKLITNAKIVIDDEGNAKLVVTDSEVTIDEDGNASIERGV